jgi:hypothetical protein
MCGSILTSCFQTPEKSGRVRAALGAPTKRKRVTFASAENCPACGFPIYQVHGDCDNCKYLVDYNGYVDFIVSDEYESQSAPVEPIPIKSEDTKQDTEQNVVFHDDLPQTVLAYGIKPSDDVYNHGMQSRSELANFLSRPVLLETYEWVPNDTFLSTRFSPWSVFLQNPSIQRKIRDYKLLRATMKIKVLLNGSPYHYGRLVVGMYPSRYSNNLGPTADPNSALATLNYLEAGLPITQKPTATLCTQRPKVFLNPSKNLPVEIHWPFFSATSWLEVNNIVDYLRMGYLEIWELNQLKVVNLSTTTAPLTIQFFGWLEDVELTGITDDFLTESSKPIKKQKKKKKSDVRIDIKEVDEFQGDGVVSAPASAIAGIAARLTDVPVIGKFAKATQIGANSIAQIASLFGFSNPNLIDKQCVLNHLQLGRMPHTSGNDVCVKLSLDPKNELTIDPSSVGLSNEDEMSFAYVAKREALVCSFTWTTNKVPRRIGSDAGFLMRAAVHPMLAPITFEGVTPNIKTWQSFTPVGYIAMPFEYWTGSLIFRVQVVCSQFHRGRLGILYTPDFTTYALPAGFGNFPQYYSHIMDISQETDASFQVNWAQAWDWNEVRVQDPADGILPELLLGNLGNFTQDMRQYANGCFQIIVVNDLTLPGDETDQEVEINVYLSAGDDFRVASPSNKMSQFFVTDDGYKDFPVESYPFIAQGSMSESAYGKQFQEDDPNQSDEYILNGDTVQMSPHMMEVYMGEDVRSIRSMLKRYCEYLIVSNIAVSNANYVVLQLSNLPTAPTPTNIEYGSVTAIDGAFMSMANVPMTYFRYYYRAYIGFRGSIKYKVGLCNTGPSNIYLQANRRNRNIVQISADTFDMDGESVSARNAIIAANPGLLSGGIVNPGAAGGGLAYELPFYERVRYIDLHLDESTLGATPFGNQSKHQITTYCCAPGDGFVNPQYFTYTACGEDAAFFFFIGVPPMRYKATT